MNKSKIKNETLFFERMSHLSTLTTVKLPNECNEKFLDILLSMSLDAINKILDSLLIQVLLSSLDSRRIKGNCLYIVSCLGVSSQVMYKLGDELISPEIEVPTVNQFYEQYDWYLRIKPRSGVLYNSVDDIVMARVGRSLGIINSLRQIFQEEINPWEEVHILQEGDHIQQRLLKRVQSELILSKKDIRLLENSRAPAFIQEECQQNFQRINSIIACLSKKRILRLR